MKHTKTISFTFTFEKNLYIDIDNLIKSIEELIYSYKVSALIVDQKDCQLSHEIDKRVVELQSMLKSTFNGKYTVRYD